MTQQHTPTLEPLTPGLYYLDTIECAKINAHDDLVAALTATLANVCQAHGPTPAETEEEDFVAELKEKFEKYGENMFLSDAQSRWLCDIAIRR